MYTEPDDLNLSLCIFLNLCQPRVHKRPGEGWDRHYTPHHVCSTSMGILLLYMYDVLSASSNRYTVAARHRRLLQICLDFVMTQQSEVLSSGNIKVLAILKCTSWLCTLLQKSGRHLCT